MMKRVAFAIICFLFFAAAQAQKGAISIAAGPLISIPLGNNGFQSDLKTGGGLRSSWAVQFIQQKRAVVTNQFGRIWQ